MKDRALLAGHMFALAAILWVGHMLTLLDGKAMVIIVLAVAIYNFILMLLGMRKLPKNRRI